jgi:hypothetical protein
MASTADQLAALGNDPQFRLRIQSLLVQQAGVVYAESGGTPNHATRVAYVKRVLSDPFAAAQIVAAVIVNRTNLVAGTTTYNFATGRVETSVTDAAISSQLATDWDMLSGV